MPAAIKPYSMAVAPDSSLKNVEMRDFMVVPTLCSLGSIKFTRAESSLQNRSPLQPARIVFMQIEKLIFTKSEGSVSRHDLK
jgi:hypothetical protein